MKKKDYRLVWSEEFDGSEINRDIWSFEEGYVRNHELQYYTDNPENSYIQDGCLVIECRKEDNPQRPYTSAALETIGKAEFLYGKIEMRAKLPYSKGIWPAFWTLGCDINEVGWPRCGEIDIMELIGGIPEKHGQNSDDTIYGTIHYPGEQNVGNTCSCRLFNEDYCDDFHIIGIEWTEEYIKWYVDGIIYNERDIRNIPEFHKPHFLIVNTAFGGDWPGDPDDTTVLPQKYYIDWIRYYK